MECDDIMKKLMGGFNNNYCSVIINAADVHLYSQPNKPQSVLIGAPRSGR
jgi:hypothetical protein